MEQNITTLYLVIFNIYMPNLLMDLATYNLYMPNSSWYNSSMLYEWASCEE
jgi:hypothetical protein